MVVKEITSRHNFNIKNAMKLRKHRERDSSGQFVIEGFREILKAFDNGVDIVKIFIAPKMFLGNNENSLVASLYSRGVQVFRCDADIFSKLSYRDRPDGLLAIANKWNKSLHDLIVDDGRVPLFLLVESIEKPGNLGTMLRTADATAVDGVIVCDKCTDIFNPNVVRASIGTLFSLPVVESQKNEALSWIKTRGLHTIVTTPSASANYTDVDMSGPLVIALGSEQYGLSKEWIDGNSNNVTKVKIPMMGQIDSLNVAVATALVLYECRRQRGFFEN